MKPVHLLNLPLSNVCRRVRSSEISSPFPDENVRGEGTAYGGKVSIKTPRESAMTGKTTGPVG